MVRKGIALAVAGLIGLSAPAYAADVKAPAKVERAAATQGASSQLVGDPALLLLLAFGVVTTAVVIAANEDLEELPASR